MDERVQQHQNEADKNEILLWACARGLIGDVTELLNQGAHHDWKDKNGYAPVHFAACHGHLEVLQELSTKGTDIDVEDRTGRTPLHFAAVYGHVDAVKFLVKKGAWLDGFDGDDNSALHLAAREGHIEVVRVLVASGAKVHLVNKRSLTCLGEALVAGHMNVAKLLVERNADVKTRSRRFTLLHLTAGLGLTDSLNFLLTHGAADLVNDADNAEKLSPIHAATAACSLTCVQLLLKHGASATQQDADGCLPADKLPPTPVGGPGGQEVRQLSKLLVAKAPARAQPKGQADRKEQESRELTFSEKFSQMTYKEQLAKVETLARLPPAELKDQKHLTLEQQSAIEVVRKTSEAVNCYNAVVAIRRDEEFQDDASDPAVQEAIEKIRETNSLEGYADKEKIMAVLLKLRQLQTVLRAAGGVKLQLQDLLVKNEPDHFSKDEGRLAAMNKNLQKAKETAVQMLGGNPVPNEEDATAAPSAPATSQPIKEQGPTGERDELGELLASDQGREQKLGFWGRLGRELLTQITQAFIVGILLLLVLWMMGRLPWRNEEWVLNQLQQHSGKSTPATPMDPAVAAHLAGQPGPEAGGQFMPQYPYGQGGNEEL